jgi:cell division protein ZapB
MEIEKFDLLAKKIEALLDRLEESSRREDDLGQRLDLKENEIKGLRDRVQSLEEERDLVRNKVEALLGRIEERVAG